MTLINEEEFVRRVQGVKTVRDLMLLKADLEGEMTARLRFLADHLTASADLHISAPREEVITLVALMSLVLERATQSALVIHGNPLRPSDIADIMTTVEKQNRAVNALYMNAREYAHLRKFGREVLEFEERPSMVNVGALCKMYGAQVMVHANIPEGWIHVVSLPVGDKPLLCQKVQVVRTSAGSSAPT